MQIEQKCWMFIAGRLCLWRHIAQRDRRLDGDNNSFQKFRNSLQLFCDQEGNSF